jgi:CRP-like cAMP-binding protein
VPLVSLAYADPGLFARVPQALRSGLATRALVRTRRLAPGAWRGPRALVSSGLGILILSGLVLRELDLFGASAFELLGDGDLLAPAALLPASVARVSQWRVLVAADVALLDDAAARRLADLPGVMPALIARAATRSDAAEVQTALTRIHPLSTRLHVLLWNLADRWGTRVNGSVQLDVPLSHQLLADLASAQRPKVTEALRTLGDAGIIERDGARGPWLLSGGPPESRRCGELSMGPSRAQSHR